MGMVTITIRVELLIPSITTSGGTRLPELLPSDAAVPLLLGQNQTHASLSLPLASFDGAGVEGGIGVGGAAVNQLGCGIGVEIGILL